MRPALRKALVAILRPPGAGAGLENMMGEECRGLPTVTSGQEFGVARDDKVKQGCVRPCL